MISRRLMTNRRIRGPRKKEEEEEEEDGKEEEEEEEEVAQKVISGGPRGVRGSAVGEPGRNQDFCLLSPDYFLEETGAMVAES